MSIFRPLGKLFQQFPIIQQLSPISTTSHLLAGSCKRPKGKPKCDPIKSVGCAPKARKDCQPVPKDRIICHRLDVPEPSYAECLKSPRPKHRMSECFTPKLPPKLCIKPNFGISIDGCQPLPASKHGTCRKRNLKKPEEKKKCDPKDVCDPDLKPYKSAGPLTETETEMKCPSSSTGSGISCPPANAGMMCPSTPMTSRVCEPEPPSSPFSTPFRNYSTKCGATAKQKKPCFSTKKIKGKATSHSKALKSRVSCDGKGINLGKCDKAKCIPTFEQCNKPPYNAVTQYKCPVRVKKPRMMSVNAAVKKRKIKMGYKTCNQPKAKFQFSCLPKVEKKKPQKPKQPTPKRCPCFQPVELTVKNSSCKKIRCSVEPDCNRKGGKAKAVCPEKCDKS